MEENPVTLIRKQPAGSFLEGFPIGNGRIGAMVTSTYPEEKIYLNHEWLWTAKWRGKKDPDENADRLPELKKLLTEEKWVEGAEFAIRNFSPRGSFLGFPARIDSFVSAGFLSICPDVSPIDHTRKLDMEKALVMSDLRCGKQQFFREVYASSTDGLIHVRYRMEKNTPFSGSVSLGRNYEKGVELSFVTKKDHLLMQGTVPGNTPFQVEAFLHTKGGECKVNGNEVIFEDVEELIVLLDVDVNKESRMEFPPSNGRELHPDWEKDLASHVENWQKYFYKCRITIPNGGIVSQYYNFGRYLLLSSFMNGELPPNLQGKWNLGNNPPWQSDYHLNINLQMNCWGCCPTALEEFNLLLFDYIDRVAEDGKKVAQKSWGCRGTCLPHATDVWGQATPEASGYSVWLGAAPWFAQHYMQHYRYTLDETFLRERAWPFLRETALFFEDILERDKNGIWQLIPSQSPENFFVGGFFISICVSSSCDVELLQELFRDAIFTAEKVGAKEYIAKWQEILTHLPPLAIGKDGRLLEWGDEKFQEVDKGHRHFSHLVGLFPGSVITEKKTPALYKAALRSLEVRLENFQPGGFVPGWSRALLSNYFALAGQGERAINEIRILAEKQSTDTLLDLHPPRIFQIDGNLGILSTIPALLVQTKDEVLTLLPALPGEWKEGKAENIRAEKALSIDLEWKEGRLAKARITAEKEVTFLFRCPENCSLQGENWTLLEEENLVKVSLPAGGSLLVTGS